MTEEDYIAGVELLERVEPTAPLLPQLRKGYTAINCVYLRHAMAGKEEVVQPKVRKLGEPDIPVPDSPEYDEMQQRKSVLYARRANLSNQFHDFEGDPVACANISDDIRKVQRQILKVQQQIQHYKITGEVLEEAPKTERVYEGLDLARKYHTTRQNVNRWRRRIDREGSTVDRPTLNKWEKKLKEYERELASLKRQVGQESV
jgi:hypothetical protein